MGFKSLIAAIVFAAAVMNVNCEILNLNAVVSGSRNIVRGNTNFGDRNGVQGSANGVFLPNILPKTSPTPTEKHNNIIFGNYTWKVR
jgi:hypothetical protein